MYRKNKLLSPLFLLLCCERRDSPDVPIIILLQRFPAADIYVRINGLIQHKGRKRPPALLAYNTRRPTMSTTLFSVPITKLQRNVLMSLTD